MPSNLHTRRKAIKIGSALGISSILTSKEIFAAKATQPTLKPKKLKKGDKIGLLAPGSAIFDQKAIKQFGQTLQQLGFDVAYGKTLGLQYGNLAGPDGVRAAEIHEMFSSSSIKGIIAMRGGWGCARLLPMLDYNLISRHPKVFMGFSDVTALLLAFYQKAGLVTFHGPMGYSTWDKFSSHWVEETLLKGKSTNMNHPQHLQPIYTISPGEAEGVLVGGNLTVLSHLMGTGYLPDWQGKILFLEEIGEEVYRIDRMITQLKLAGILQQLAGFIFGTCVRCEAAQPAQSLAIQDIWADHIAPLGIPSFSGGAFGHAKEKLTLPVGIKVRMNADTGQLKLLEAAVQ